MITLLITWQTQPWRGHCGLKSKVPLVCSFVIIFVMELLITWQVVQASRLEVESRKYIFSEYVAITSGCRWFLVKIRWRWLMEAAFCWLQMLMIKNDDKSQITAFLCFYLRGLMQREALVRFRRVLPLGIYKIFRNKNYRLSTFNRDAFFRVQLVTASITS